MVQLGLPVPEGFCISADSFLLDAQQRIQEWGETTIERSGVPAILYPDVQKQVNAALNTLEEKYGKQVSLAVRSSAIQEDLPGASYAGQYKTILNVCGADRLLHSIAQCYSSAWSDSLHAYQSIKELTTTSQIAIVVQVMVQADFSGILFTADPRTLDSSQLVVEMAIGLGDIVASGEVNPIRFSIDRKTGLIQKLQKIHEKSRDVDLSKVPWDELFNYAMSIESIFHAPQDIEWAYHENHFWILQSRPITTFLSSSPRLVWSRANVGEILPGVIKPLSWSIFKPILLKAGYYRDKSPLTIHWNWQHPSGKWPDSPRLAAGRVYMDLASVFTSFANSPGVNAEILQKVLGFEFNYLRANEFPIKRPRKHVADPMRWFLFWMEALGITHLLEIAASKRQKRFAKFLIGRNLDSLSNQNLSIIKRIECLSEEAAKTFSLHLQTTSFAFSTFALMDALVKKYTTTSTAQRFETSLTSEFHEISTAQQTIAIWDLAHTIRENSYAWDALLHADPIRDVLKVWYKTPEAASVVEKWDVFISKFGDRGTQEFELSKAHWDEDPSIVLKTVREIIESDQTNPYQRLSQNEDESTQLVHQIKKQIRENRGMLFSLFFSLLYKSFSHFVPLRENCKYQVIRWFNSIRKETLQLGENFVKQGFLETYDDIFYLTYREIKNIILHPVSKNKKLIKSTLIQRKNEDQTYHNKPTFDLIITYKENDIPISLKGNLQNNVLKGIPGCHGIAIGSAYVLELEQSISQISPGQILVTSSVDPGLTPLLINATGLVTEIGGFLSHGATLARELGIPTVVSVPQATKLIRNGQKIMVNGYNGEVKLIEE